MLILGIIYFLTLIYLLYLSLYKNTSIQRFVVKTFNCLLFVIIFIINYYSTNINNKLFIPMLIAFILSFIGDLGLGFYHIKKNKIYQGIGFIGFCLAQFVYVYSFISNFGYNLYLLFIPLIGVILGQYFVYKLKLNNIGINILAFVYMSLVCLMFSSTLSVLITLQNRFSLILLSGGITFAISDYTLLFKYYTKKNKNLFTVISVLTYGIAQFLLAISILFI